MPLATKNNALIVKDGKVAESCGCCRGWYCYQSCATTVCGPCGYSKPMPQSLNVSVFFDVSSTIYAAARGSVLSPFVASYWPTRIQASDFASASKAFSLTLNSGCLYQGLSEQSPSRHSILAALAESGELFPLLGWNGPTCDACSRRPSFSELSLRINANRPTITFQEQKYNDPLTGWVNADSNTYNTYDLHGAEPASATGEPVIFQQINGVKYPLGVLVIANKASGVDVPECAVVPYDVIDYTYRFDLTYTQCAGSVLSIQTLPRALVVRIYE